MAAVALLASCGDSAVSEGAGDTAVERAEPETRDTAPVDTSPCGSPPPGSRLAALCALPPSPEPLIGDAVVVAPSPSLPEAVRSQTAHNNLDVEWHAGRLFMAVRTAPTHFASPETTMFVVSTADLDSWRFEGRFTLGTDVREPQLVSFPAGPGLDPGLTLTFAVLGTDPLAFQPQGSRRAVWLGPGRFGPAEEAFGGDLLPWRIKTLVGPDGATRLHAMGYTGGADIYENDGDLIEVHWLSSVDGVTFGPAHGDDAIVLRGGASETDVVYEEDGGVTAVSRNEAGDAEGFGSLVCHAAAASPMAWSCAHDPRKYDSPLLFRHKGKNWLVARRNVTDSGHYDLNYDEKPLSEQYTQYQLDYWGKPKRCALWAVDSAALAVTHVQDLPSRGDTCFPERVELTQSVSLIFNYTSPLDGADPSWIDAQTGPTQVVYTSLQLN